MRVANRFQEAFIKLVFFSALIHLGALTVSAVRDASFAPLNYFNILHLGLLFPNAVKGVTSHYFSLIVAAIVYVVIFAFFTSGNADKR